MSPSRKKKNWLEWSVFSIGLALVSGIVAYLVYDLATAPSGPPRVSVELGPVQERGGRFEVPVTVRNQGQEVAEQVEIEAELTMGSGQTEKSGFTVPRLPRGASREGTVTFTHDPRRAEQVIARVRGYLQP